MVDVYSMSRLAENLGRCGKQVATLAVTDGSRLLVLPQHGRVLGLYPAKDETNFLWTNPALADAAAAQAYFAKGGWPNPGGDRTWLAPELELFIGDPQRVSETYAVQPALDPGRWTLAPATDTELRMTQSTGLRLHRAKRDVRVRMEKVITPAVNPLPSSALSYAGYTQRTTLEVEPMNDGSAIRLGIWNLLQLPQPGTMLIPTRVATSPQKVFGEFAEGELTADAHGVRWEMTAPGPDAKISLKAGALTGRAACLRRDPPTGTADLVVREFDVTRDDDYVDALWTPPHEAGWAFQACCVRNGPERFNELEYHAPAAAAAPGRNAGCDTSRVWAFRGPAAAILEAAEMLLGRKISS